MSYATYTKWLQRIKFYPYPIGGCFGLHCIFTTGGNIPVGHSH